MPEETNTELQQCLNRLQQGDETAREDLMRMASGRLTELARAMLRDYRRLKRWEETDDVAQGALLRMHRALQAVTPPTPRDFYRLATAQIRRELIDLTRHYFGPAGPGTNLDSLPPSDRSDSETPPTLDQGDASHEPGQLALWTDFHRQVEQLPEEEREVFDLVWYQGLKHIEAATVLNVSARTITRRWQAACLKLHQALRGILPGS
jgi:RNA polymerase sigma-70 factor (ECF subfamily)